MRRNLMPKVDSFDNDTTMAINVSFTVHFQFYCQSDSFTSWSKKPNVQVWPCCHNLACKLIHNSNIFAYHSNKVFKATIIINHVSQLQSNKNCIGLVQNENEPAILFFKKCPSAAPECTKLRLTIWHELRIHDRMCLDWGYPRIRFLTCHGQGGNQITYYNAKRQVNASNFCNYQKWKSMKEHFTFFENLKIKTRWRISVVSCLENYII